MGPNRSFVIINQQQQEKLQSHFQEDPCPSQGALVALANRVGLEEQVVQKWFMVHQAIHPYWTQYRRWAPYTRREPHPCQENQMIFSTSWSAMYPSRSSPSIRSFRCFKHPSVGTDPKAMGGLSASPWDFPKDQPGSSSQGQACGGSAQEGIPAAATQPWGPSASHLSGTLEVKAFEALDALKRLSVSATTSGDLEKGDLADRNLVGLGNSSGNLEKADLEDRDLVGLGNSSRNLEKPDVEDGDPVGTGNS